MFPLFLMLKFHLYPFKTKKSAIPLQNENAMDECEKYCTDTFNGLKYPLLITYCFYTSNEDLRVYDHFLFLKKKIVGAMIICFRV